MGDDVAEGCGCGCFGCLLAIAIVLAGIGLVGVAWKFVVWAWN